MSSHLNPVREALRALHEAPIDGFDAANDGYDDRGEGDRFDRPPPAMPDGCPVVPVGTEDGVFYFLTALGELRGLTADKVSNNHIKAMFAPEIDYLYGVERWQQKKLAKKKDNNGDEIEEWVTTGGLKTQTISEDLLNVGAAKGVWNAREKVRGRGAWRGDDGGLILHTGNHVLIGGRWERPGMYDGMVYPTAPPIPKPAGKAAARGEQLAPELVGSLRARGIAIASDASPAAVLLELLKTWNWARPRIDPILLLGWIGAAMIGGALDYRPLAWMTGDKATGKSALQKLIGWLFDGGILQSPKPSEAGVRQVLGQQSLPVGIDELEASEDNRKALDLVELARLAASSQGNILKGGQDHKGHEFRVTACFLFSSILVPPIPPQDKSRLAMLELGELPAGSREPKIDKREIAAIGGWLRKRLADRWGEWPTILECFTDALIDHGGQGGRAADQFGTLRAAAHVLLDAGMPDDEELVLWAGMLGVSALAETSEATGESPLCLQHMASSPVQLEGRGLPKLVSEWLLDASEPIDLTAEPDVQGAVQNRRAQADKALGRAGMRIVVPVRARGAGAGQTDRAPIVGQTYVAVAVTHQGLAKLFENSRWAKGVWTQAMRRVPGAIGGETQRIGGIAMKCTFVPIEAIVEREDMVDFEEERT